MPPDHVPSASYTTIAQSNPWSHRFSTYINLNDDITIIAPDIARYLRALLPVQNQPNVALATYRNRTLRRGQAIAIPRRQIRPALDQRTHNRQVTEHDGVVQRRRLQGASAADADVGAVERSCLVAGDGCEVQCCPTVAVADPSLGAVREQGGDSGFQALEDGRVQCGVAVPVARRVRRDWRRERCARWRRPSGAANDLWIGRRRSWQGPVRLATRGR